MKKKKDSTFAASAKIKGTAKPPASPSVGTARFVTFEGGEGAGKSTQIGRLAKTLADNGIPAIITREPGGSPGAEAIRHVLLSGAAEPFGPNAEAMLFAAARADHIDQTVKPALDSGTWVLCDRFIDSTRVYQGKGGADPKLLDALERVAVGDVLPDLTIIIDLPASVGMERAKSRLELASTANPDRFEKENLAIQEKRRLAFLEIAKKNSGRCVVIDGQQDIDGVALDVWKSVSKLAVRQNAKEA